MTNGSDNATPPPLGAQARADLGSRSALPGRLQDEYVVESSFEDQVRALLAERPARVMFLEKVAARLHGLFGCDSRLMLAAPWSLFEPIGPMLHIVVYTQLAEEATRVAATDFEAESGREMEGHRITLAPVPLSTLSPSDRERLRVLQAEGG